MFHGIGLAFATGQLCRVLQQDAVYRVMEKNLTVYPISTGNELNVFSAERINGIRIMDMNGIEVLGAHGVDGTHNIIDIKSLPGATYIVEVQFSNHRTGRSVFVKM